MCCWVEPNHTFIFSHFHFHFSHFSYFHFYFSHFHFIGKYFIKVNLSTQSVLLSGTQSYFHSAVTLFTTSSLAIIKKHVFFQAFPELVLTFDIWHLTYVIWHLTFDICHLTFDIWHLSFDIWHDILQSEKLPRVTDSMWFKRC